MSKQTLEEIFNLKKDQVIAQLKKKGKYINCSKEYGYIYSIDQVIKGKKMLFTLGLKAGRILVVDMKYSYIA
ncbi:hypothetical protein [Gracilibacillus sp. YIM 98692]|uniref:hypothetical protein n=1 Tax=Gracilibacillus sp. YIM 98692 TaxID=2663532 RepID=UPI0013D82A5E|nr:hypothetical protein [Gracilibacillus sp. YIM 98692]